MHMDKQITQSILVMLCSMRGTKIARVEGLWLVNRPKHLISEDPDVTIICFDLAARKPLCMHIRNIAIHLHTCWHPCKNPKYYKCIQTSLSFP